MLPRASLLHKCRPAPGHQARMRPAAGVCPHVTEHVAAIGKHVVADRAFVRPHAAAMVAQLVDLQSAQVHEVLAARVAPVRPDTGVAAPVHRERRVCRKDGAAVGALVAPFSSVHTPVVQQLGARVERHAALVAEVAAVDAVTTGMAPQLSLEAELERAMRALERLLAGVLAHVHLDVGRPAADRLVAQRARLAHRRLALRLDGNEAVVVPVLGCRTEKTTIDQNDQKRSKLNFSE